MKCEIVRDLIPLYCDGLCSDETKAAVEEHVQACENCKKLLEAAAAEVAPPAGETYDEEQARVLQGVKKRYSRIRWHAVLLAVGIVVALAAAVFGVWYHFNWPTHHHYPDINIIRFVQESDPRLGGVESYREMLGLSWVNDPKAENKMRELSLWNHAADLEFQLFYTAPYHIEVSGEVKDGKTTFRYEGYVTTKEGETIDYEDELTLDFALVPEGKTLIKDEL